MIEILAVMVILGILSSVILVALGNQRERSRVSSATATAKSILPFAQECVFYQDLLNQPANSTTGGNLLCANSKTVWPAIGAEGCSYDSNIGGANVYRINCNRAGKKIVCQTANVGECSVSDL